MKEERTGGRKEKEGRTRRGLREMHGKHKITQNFQKETILYQKQLSFLIYVRLFKGGRNGRGNEGTRRDSCTRMRSYAIRDTFLPP